MGTALIALFGILLPAVALGMELIEGMSAEIFFNPIPTLAHVLLVAFVPLANLLALVGSLNAWTRARAWLLWANGMVLGITLIYALAFLPMAPVGVIGIIFFGMGLLPLAPLCSLICAAALRRRLLAMPAAVPAGAPVAAAAPFRSPASLWGGAVLGALLLLAAEAMVTLTMVGAEMAASDSPARRAHGLRLLRKCGNPDELLRMCYRDGSRRGFLSGASRSSGISGFALPQIARADAQKVFFRVTGQPFNSLPPPRNFRDVIRDDFDFDPDVGGQAVAGRRKGLSLASSRIDAQIHPDAAVAYLEWEMVLHNDRPRPLEARAQILLPPGGVVSRVTLWVNGEPREAAFAGTGQVREAYQRVAVVEQRDPLLVTWAGVDRVMAQCFPVPAQGEMKIRLGITAPLVLASAAAGKPSSGEASAPAAAALRLPCFAERNFGVTAEAIHSLWAESDRPYEQVPEQLATEQPGPSRHVLRGALSDEDLLSPASAVFVTRSAAAVESWTPDPKDAKRHVVQKLTVSRASAMRRIVLVVDGSLAMAEHFDAIADALGGLSEGVETHVLLAGDGVVDLSDIDAGGLVERLRKEAGVGGCDNLPALREALDLSTSGDTAIVWIHAAQPVLLQPVAFLLQRLERGGQVPIHDVAVAAGPNRVVEELKNVGCVHTVPRLGALSDDLRGLFARLSGQTKEFQIERAVVEGPPPTTPKASSHIARLWAAGQAAVLARGLKSADRDAAVKLAAGHQLVTPASGAVVLENQQQYEQSKLHPVDPDSTPVVPEPSTLALLLAALPLGCWWAWRRKNRGGRR